MKIGRRYLWSAASLGSVVEVYQAGSLKADASYTADGDMLSASWNMSSYSFRWLGGWGYRYTGKDWMNTYVRARHYSTSDGAWGSVDPLWPDEAAYRFVEWRVMEAVDPSGELPRLLRGVWDTGFCASVQNYVGPWPWTGKQRFWNGFDPFSFNYGNCCGALRRCGERSPYIDDLDKACRDHDWCLRTDQFCKPSAQENCNIAFCNRVLGSSCLQYMGIQRCACETARHKMAALFCPIGYGLKPVKPALVLLPPLNIFPAIFPLLG